MASFMPAACSPWAMDQAIERLLATPKTTALRPCRSEDMSAPWKGKEYQRRARIYHKAEAKPLNTGDTEAHGVANHFAALTSSTAAAVPTGQLAATKANP